MVLAQVNTAATQQEFRLLFIDLQGNVRADSQGGWVGHPTAALNNGDEQAGGLIQAGFFDAPNGLEFQFAALPDGPADQPVGYVAVVRPRLSSALGLLTGFGWGLVTAGAVALLVSLLLGVLIARSIARPLQHIAAAAGAATAGNYE